MRLPFETDYLPGVPRQVQGQVKKWLEVLDDLGTENVRIRLAQSSGGPDDTFYRAGEIAVPKGFAEDWLRYSDRRARAVETRWRWAIFIPACISALAASAAGVVVLAPRLSSALHGMRTSPPTAPPAPAAGTTAAASPVAASPVTSSPVTASRSGWRTVSANEHVVINGNLFEAEAGPQPEAIQRTESSDVVRFQMIAGNRWAEDAVGGDERTELDGYKQPFEPGVSYWVAYSLYIEPGPRFTADWIALGQIPGLMGHILKNGTIMTWVLAGKLLHSETISQGQTYQFVEKFIVDPANGSYGSWLNGRQVADYHGPLGAPGKKYYYKIGIYRGHANETMAVRYANYKFGTTDLSALIANPAPVPPLQPWP